MSGICGIFHFDGEPVAQRDLDRQIERLAHLGPDRARAWCAGTVGLGHLMMRVTREDRSDAQPLHDAGLSLVADLRLDNREELAAARCRSVRGAVRNAGQRAAVRGLQKWGVDCVDSSARRFRLRCMGRAEENAHAGARPHGAAPCVLSQRRGLLRLRHGDQRAVGVAAGAASAPGRSRREGLLFDEPTDVGATAAMKASAPCRAPR